MTKAEALHNWFAGFGIPAYEQNSVPDSAEYPYLTYETADGSCFEKRAVDASLWYRSSSWATCNNKANAIGDAIGYADFVKCDEGAMIIRKGEPFMQSMGDENDDMVKRKILQLEITFITK